MVTVSPLRLLHSWREQHEAKRTHVLAEGILAVMRRHQADTRAELLFSTELLTKFVGAEVVSRLMWKSLSGERATGNVIAHRARSRGIPRYGLDAPRGLVGRERDAS
jgi:hypothetical protein